MKIVSVFKIDRDALTDVAPDEKAMVEMGQLIGEMKSKGVLVDTGGVFPSGLSMRVRRTGRDVAVTDGPFTESKEVVGGFAVLQVDTREEGITWTRRFLELAGDGVCEIHQVTEFP